MTTWKRDENGVWRDQFTRPGIVFEPGGERTAVTRASTLGNVVENQHNLTQWKLRQVAVGLAARPDLAALAVAKADDKRTLDSVVESSLEVAQSRRGANLGTAIHALTERLDLGLAMPAVPEDMAGLLSSYQEATANMRVLHVERFCVADHEGVRAAGTFDRLLQLPSGRVVIGDLKTGTDAWRYAQGAAVQMSVYAHARLYDPTADVFLDDEDMAAVDKRNGIMIHADQHSGTVKLYWVDLATGWRFAKIATEVRKWHAMRNLTRPVA